MDQEKKEKVFMSHLDSLNTANLHSFIHELSSQKGFLEGIADRISEGILVVDDRFKIKYKNNAAAHLLGIPEDFSNLSILTFLKGIDCRQLAADVDSGVRREIEILYPERRVIRFYLVRHKEQNLTTVILTDITEEYDRAASKAESERGKLVSMLAASVAHEIGNPLNSLYLNLQLLQRMLAAREPDLDEALENVNEARREVERLDSIINQFLKALRPAKLKFLPTDLKTTVTDALSFMRHEIENRNVEVKCVWDPGLPLIQADESQLKQALYNLIKNAIQSMAEGGNLTIQCEPDEAGENLRLSISDTGSGISGEDLSKIFNPYFTTKSGGNGLGLMIVERIIREHGAKLSVESAKGAGTTFVIDFPLNSKRMRVLPPPPPAVAGILPEAKKDLQK